MRRPTALALWAVATPSQERTVPAAQSRVGRGRLAVPAAGAGRRERAHGARGGMVLVARANAWQRLRLMTLWRGRRAGAVPGPCGNEVSYQIHLIRLGARLSATAAAALLRLEIALLFLRLRALPRSPRPAPALDPNLLDSVSPARRHVRRSETDRATETGFVTTASRVFNGFCVGTDLATDGSAAQTDAR